MTTPEPTLLQQANKAYRDGDYLEAYRLYSDIVSSGSTQAVSVTLNLKLCEQKLKPEDIAAINKKKKIEIIQDAKREETALQHNNENIDVNHLKPESVILFHIDDMTTAKEMVYRIELFQDIVDVIVTFSKTIAHEVDSLLNGLKCKYTLLVLPTKGHHIFPFLESVKLANKLGYKYFCKIHTSEIKAEPEIIDNLRLSLLDGVLASRKIVQEIIHGLRNQAFNSASSAMNFLSYRYTKANQEQEVNLLFKALGVELKLNEDFGYFAESFFWGRVNDFAIKTEDITAAINDIQKKRQVKSSEVDKLYMALEFVIGYLATKEIQFSLVDIHLEQDSFYFNLTSSDNCRALRLPNKTRVQYYDQLELMKKFILLQKSGLVDASWCYAENELDGFYDCYWMYLNGKIPYLSKEHKEKILKIDFKDNALIVKCNDDIKQYVLSDDLLSNNLQVCKILDINPEFISPVNDVMVSVVCITYKHEAYIAQALESILTQKTNFKFELLISDDCSPDNTSGIIESFKKRYPDKVNYIKRLKNIGARNNSTDLLQKAKGKYIAFNEGDDYWINENKLQIQVDYLETTPECSLCFHQVKVISESDPNLISFFPGKQPKSIFTTEDLIERNYIQTNSLVFRKNSLGLSKLSDERIMPGDWYRHILNSLSGDAHLLPDVMSVYRKHPGGIWSSVGANLHKKWGLQETVFFDAIDKQLNYKYHSNFFGKKYSLYKISFFNFYVNNEKEKLFELACIDVGLTNFFMKKHGIPFFMKQDMRFDEFIGCLIDAISIDVIVTSYNHEQHIEQALNSVLEQEGLFKLNIFVSDDCSKDNTLSKIKISESKANGIIKNISPANNLGLQKNMQHCFSHIKANYFAICEGDDYWLDKSKIRKQLCYLIENQDASMCFNWVLLEYVNKGYTIPHPGQEKISSDHIDFEYILKTAVTANFSCCMYRTELLNSIPKSYYENPRSADWLFNLYAANEGKVGFLRDILSVYRVHDGGQWSKLSPSEQALRKNEGYKLFRRLFPEKKACIDKYINHDIGVRPSSIDTNKKIILDSGEIKANLDKKSCDFGFFTLYGWAFVKNSNHLECGQAWLVILDSNKKLIKSYLCQKIKRPDVRQALKDCDSDYSGFKITFELPKSLETNSRVAICYETKYALYAQSLMNIENLFSLEKV